MSYLTKRKFEERERGLSLLLVFLMPLLTLCGTLFRGADWRFDYLGEFSLYETLEINGNKYILIHGGLGNFSKDKKLEDYTIHEIVWTLTNYDEAYFDDIYVITGHTPTQFIEANDKPGFIYRKNNHIAIDCGACHPDGRLAAIRLDDGEEYYVP